jgi:hypothetical protein
MSLLFRERCQLENSIYRYAPVVDQLRLLRRALRRRRARLGERAGLGAASRFAAGEFVRVKDATAVRATLDGENALRGLAFTNVQWAYCGKTFRVDAVVRRIMNDEGVMRRAGRTVSLAGVTCGGPAHDGGCGRACPLLFRDEWLEPSSAELAEPVVYEQYVRIRPLSEILAGLDRDGRRDGVMFASEMGRFAGARLPVLRTVQPIAATRWRRAGAEWFILAGIRCSGAVLGGEGPCDRGCGLLWHRDWLEFEPALCAAPAQCFGGQLDAVARPSLEHHPFDVVVRRRLRDVERRRDLRRTETLENEREHL